MLNICSAILSSVPIFQERFCAPCLVLLTFLFKFYSDKSWMYTEALRVINSSSTFLWNTFICQGQTKFSFSKEEKDQERAPLSPHDPGNKWRIPGWKLSVNI